MEFFTALGIVITCVVISTIFYYFISHYLGVGDEELDGIIAFVILAAIVSILFASFIVNPESSGYQRINTVSASEVSE